MNLYDAIAEAIANSAPPPANESNTCDWIILPLLLGCGYARREIVSRTRDVNGQFPDFTILPDTENCWYLEAKSWSTGLVDQHVLQSLNYANQNGKRWVVLSNGHEWKLYDNWIQGVAADKLVAQAQLNADSEFEIFMTALSKESITDGKLERFVIRQRLTTVMNVQLRDETSEAIRSLWTSVKRQPGLSGIKRSDISEWFKARELRQAAGSCSIVSATIGVDEYAQTAEPPSPATERAFDLETLRMQADTLVTGRAPMTLACPGGPVTRVKSWRELTTNTIGWLLANQLDGPALLRPGRGEKAGFLNVGPTTKRGKPMRVPVEVNSLNGQSVYFEANRSAKDFVNQLCETCEAAGVPPNKILITLEGLSYWPT